MTQAFVGELQNVADDPRVRRIADRIGRPVRVAVLGREGVGRGHVATALHRRGVAVSASHDGDVCVLVVAEAVKRVPPAARKPVPDEAVSARG